MKLKKQFDIGATPLDQSFKLRKIGDMPFLDTSQGVEWDTYGSCCFT